MKISARKLAWAAMLPCAAGLLAVAPAKADKTAGSKVAEVAGGVEEGQVSATRLSLPTNSVPMPMGDMRQTGPNALPVAVPVAHSGRKAWGAKVASGGARSPGATEGMVVVGSGSGNRIHGLDGETGQHVWTAESKDSGISDIVIGLGGAGYTTYSCTLELVDVQTGKIKFAKWISPTVDCGPAADAERFYAAYSNGSGHAVSAHGKHGGGTMWKAKLDGTVLTAPVPTDKGVMVATGDGRLINLAHKGGTKAWESNLGLVAAPVQSKWGLLLTTSFTGDWNGVKAAEPNAKNGESKGSDRETATNFSSARTVVATGDRQIMALKNSTDRPDATQTTKIQGPKSNLDFQGLRPGVSDKMIVFAYDGQIIAVDPGANKVLWRIETDTKREFTRPVMYEGLVLLGTKDGYLMALDESSGDLVWSYHVRNESFVYQPAVDVGRVYFTTAQGAMISMPTGFSDHERNAAGEVMPPTDYAWVKARFNKVRKAVHDELKKAGHSNGVGPNPEPQANKQQGQGSQPARREDDATDNSSEATLPEAPTRGQFDRAEDRRAERPNVSGRPVERKDFKRE